MIRVSPENSRQFSMANLAPDLTPLLDIIFIVLVFLLLTANMRLASLPMDLPASEHAAAAMPAHPLTISLSNDGPELWGIDGEGFRTQAEFERSLMILLAAEPDRSVALASDRNVPVQRMLDLFALLQKQGVEVAEIALQPHTASAP
ncbi:ExbD/TolR family protein [Microbulbifer agarilyticus]|uniref:ExbD/TolR family protein n=1 Tax=Microbulbifer agarilyticus TaxID=260552 RepID=UPI001C960529|nr:biopolymer transporter ExbD [Microbulbifer agarilyticus]MBY6210268.1 biopolymer transporter ExbD [Microbulbifer agarilyticus]MCA0892759.1 biopolymer transporter ExbD [Microbulbifer agarilyticus]